MAVYGSTREPRQEFELLDGKTLLVGLGHRARHGKDWLAHRIHSLSPTSTKIYHLGDALKAWCRIQGYMYEKNGAVLQAAGMFLRQMDQPIFIRALEYYILEDAPEIALIPDIRFLNEKEWVEDHGITIRVTRTNKDGSVYIAGDRPDNHPSEQELARSVFDWNVEAESGDLAALDSASWQLWREIHKIRFGADVDIRWFA